VFCIVNIRVSCRKVPCFTTQHTAFLGAICRVSDRKTPFSGIKRHCFIAQKKYTQCNCLYHNALHLHTFPCRFCALPTFILRHGAYSGVMKKQKERDIGKIKTLCKGYHFSTYKGVAKQASTRASVGMTE